MKNNFRRGFTLVEILAVVIILGILAAIAIPGFGSASGAARVGNIQANLSRIRTQLGVFQVQHNDFCPQTVGMWALLTTTSDTTETNVAVPSGTAFGPYLNAVPANPITGLTGVSSVAIDPAAGWYYTITTNSCILYARDAGGNQMTTY